MKTITFFFFFSSLFFLWRFSSSLFLHHYLSIISLLSPDLATTVALANTAANTATK